MITLVHYRKKCIGCGICYELQPTLWRMSKKDGKANLIGSVLKKDVCTLRCVDLIALSERVARSCPARAIKVVVAGN